MLLQAVFLSKNPAADVTTKRFKANIVNTSHVLCQVALCRANLGAEVTLKRIDVAKTMYEGQVILQDVFSLEKFRADVTLECLDVTKAVNTGQMQFQTAFLSKRFTAEVTLERLDVTNAVNSR